MAIKLALFLLGAVALSSGNSIDSSPFENTLFPYPRIVGGEDAGPGERPEIVAIIRYGYIGKSLVCGASLVSRRAALTAAHCNDAIAMDLFYDDVYIAAGHNSHSSGREYLVNRYINHPQWNTFQIKFDIGLLFLRDPVELSDLVQTIAIHQPVIEGGESGTFYGWGRVVTGGAGASSLKKLTTPILSHDDCVERRNLAEDDNPQIYIPSINKEAEICTYHSIGNGACQGDSGSPLVLTGTNQQVGVVSWGLPCAVGGPDVFARVSTFASWIQENQLD